MDQRCIYKLDGLHNVKKNNANARFQDPPFGLLFPTLALFLAPNHGSSPITIIILAIHSIANYNFFATAHARVSQKGGKLAHFLRSVAIAAVHPVYIYIVAMD